ncbi:MAG: helix-turn-helix domain-containing protein [Lachnospiraceae bacterium]|nr:helix-turn-helix domain-containing protein [Lachnospiraceae bacterium]
MAKFKEYEASEIGALCDLGKALSSPVRLEMMQLLYEGAMNIGEIAKALDLPASSAAFHLNLLEQAGLIRMEKQPGTRGAVKLCIRKVDYVTINLIKKNRDIDEVYSAELPVGAFSSCKVSPTCGMFGADGSVGNEDSVYCFYYPDRMKAGILWTSSGYVEYKFANGVPKNRRIKKLTLSAEICSEAPAYREDWKSDITFWINGLDTGTWTCPGDFGARRGRLNPPEWANGNTQYGILVMLEINPDGTYLNGRRIGNVTVDQLELMKSPCVTVRIGNKEDAKYPGGINIFGKHFGDYNQDIVLTMEY